MKFLKCISLATLSAVVTLSSAEAEVNFSYLNEFAGWYAVFAPPRPVTVIRDDRPGVRILLLPEDDAPVTSEEEAIARVDAIKLDVANKYEQCAPLRNKELQNNGMGFDAFDQDEAPKCHLFISTTKQKKLFANIRIDDGKLDPQSNSGRQVALVFLHLAVARIQGDAFLREDGTTTDLARLAQAIPSGNIPQRMVAGERNINTTDIMYFAIPDSKDKINSTMLAQRAIPLFADKTGNACSDWDPTFYTAETLAAVDQKSQWYAHAAAYRKVFIPCEKFEWRESATTGIEVNLGDGWGPASEAMGYNDLGDVKPFEKNERLNVRFGDSRRISKVISGAEEARFLASQDIVFLPDGRFFAGNLNLPTYAFGVYGSRGKYYVDGHTIILDVDDGPILAAYAGKTEAAGGISKIFIGGSAYGYVH
jgi:hypothetical protein